MELGIGLTIGIMIGYVMSYIAHLEKIKAGNKYLAKKK